jgi:hypothetical protein
MSKATIPPSIGTGGSIFGGGGGLNCAKSGKESSVKIMINFMLGFIGVLCSNVCSCWTKKYRRFKGLNLFVLKFILWF